MSCEKITFETFAEAQSTVNKANSFGRVKGPSKRRLAQKRPKRAYKCDHCNKYHLTSKKSKDRKRKPR